MFSVVGTAIENIVWDAMLPAVLKEYAMGYVCLPATYSNRAVSL